MEIERKFFNPYAEVLRHQNRMPHWQQPGATIFVTYRLADSIPQAVIERWQIEREVWMNRLPKPWTVEQVEECDRAFYEKFEAFLDEGHGSCVLRDAAIAKIVGDTLANFDGERYRHHAWVVMPNHVHILFTLGEGRTLESEMKAWKGVSARRINDVRSASGEVWQKDYRDRMVRDSTHFWRCARYIRRNPEKARLRGGDYLLYEEEAVRETLKHPDAWR